MIKMNKIAIDKVMIGKLLVGLCPLLPADRIGDALAVLTGEKQAVIEANQPLEGIIKQKDAASLLGITTKALLYHVRKGRIREVKLNGSTRALGYVRADIIALLNGAYHKAA